MTVTITNKKKLTTGILTDGDLKRITNLNTNFKNLKVKVFMKKNPVSVDKNVLAAEALSIMNSKKITSLCVKKSKKDTKTIGIIHIHNILEANVS